MEICKSCGRTIGDQEQQFSYAGSVVCQQCAQRLAYAPPPGGAFPGDPYAQYGPRRSNGMAVAGLVCGIVGFIPVVNILAIIFGAIGISRTRDPRTGGKGMAIAGLVLGILWLLATPAILLPALNSAREQAKRAKCASNLRQIGMAIMMYQSENGGAPPTDLRNRALFDVYGLSDQCLVCPTSNDTMAVSASDRNQPGHCSYVYLGKGLTRSQMRGDIILVYENTANHPRDGMNLLFGDGSVRWVRMAEAQDMIDAQRRKLNLP